VQFAGRILLFLGVPQRKLTSRLLVIVMGGTFAENARAKRFVTPKTRCLQHYKFFLQRTTSLPVILLEMTYSFKLIN
jgi:hypothetical protein